MRSETGRARPTMRSRSRKRRSATLPEPPISCLTCWSSFAKSGLVPQVRHVQAAEHKRIEERRGGGQQNGAVRCFRLQRFDRRRPPHASGAARRERVAPLAASRSSPCWYCWRCAALLPERGPCRRAASGAASGPAAPGGRDRIEEVALVRVTGAARAVQLEVRRQQAHRSVRLAAQERIEVCAECRDGLASPRRRSREGARRLRSRGSRPASPAPR